MHVNDIHNLRNKLYYISLYPNQTSKSMIHAYVHQNTNPSVCNPSIKIYYQVEEQEVEVEQDLMVVAEEEVAV